MSSKRLALTAALLALVLGTLAVTSLALFTDTETVESSVFGVGTVDLAASPTTALFDIPLMVPGDQVVAPLEVSNSGNLELRYSARSTTSEDVLASTLELTIKVGVSDCSAGGFGADGSLLYGPASIGSTAGTLLFGNPDQGSQPGDRVLVPGASEQLCMMVSLPLGTGNDAQGLSTEVVLDFDSEQTRNNP